MSRICLLSFITVLILTSCGKSPKEALNHSIEIELKQREESVKKLLDAHIELVVRAQAQGLEHAAPDKKARWQYILTYDSAAKIRFENWDTQKNTLLSMNRAIIDDYVKNLDNAYQWRQSAQFDKELAPTATLVWRAYRERFLNLERLATRISTDFERWEKQSGQFWAPNG